MSRAGGNSPVATSTPAPQEPRSGADANDLGPGPLSGRVRPVEWALLAVALIVSLALRFHALGTPGLWVDEAYTVNVSLRPLGELLAQLQADDAPPFYYLLQSGMLRIFGTSEFSVRLLSAIASSLTTVVLWAWARRLGAAGIVAILWSATSIAVFYAQQARSYALLHLGVALLLWLGTRIWESPRPERRDSVAFLLVALGLLYAHNLAVWTLLAAFAWIAPRYRSDRRTGLLLLGAFSLGAVPWVTATVSQLGVHAELNEWMGKWWETHSLWLGPLYSLGVFANGTAAWVRPPTPFASLPSAYTLAAYVVWAMVASGIVLAAITTVRPRLRAGALGPWLLLAAPFAGLVLTTLVIGPAYVVGRTDTFALVPFVGLLGWGFSRHRIGWGLTLFWMAIGAWLVWTPTSNPKATDRDLATWIGSEVENGDAVVVSALGRPTLEHYATRDGWRARLGDLRAYPAVLDENPAAVFPTPVDSVAAYESEARALRARWEATGTRNVWILTLLLGTEHAGFPAGGALPMPPPAARATLTANDLPYPMSVLVYSLRGLEPVDVLREYRQDWVGGDRVVLRIPTREFISPDSLKPIGAGS
ncbi:MAG: glycosyltransferase family 39 protein [Candidatus Eisenbacteria bacterium]